MTNLQETQAITHLALLSDTDDTDIVLCIKNNLCMGNRAAIVSMLQVVCMSSLHQRCKLDLALLLVRELVFLLLYNP